MNSDSINSSNVIREIQALQPCIKPPVPNPAPLGLFGFALTTALLQIKHTRIGGDLGVDLQGVDGIVVGYAMFFGGLTQFVAGLGEVRRNNLFGYTAFLMYGGFWMALALVDILHMWLGNPINLKALQAMLFLMAIPTVALLICSLRIHKTMTVVFGLLSITFFLLMGGVRNENVDKAAGWFGLATAAMAYWLGCAELINDLYFGGVEVIPLGRYAPPPAARRTMPKTATAATPPEKSDTDEEMGS